MVTVRACVELAPFLRENLRQRLCAIGDGSKTRLAPPPSQPQAEEALRQLMVRYRPRIAARVITRDDLSMMLDQAAIVASAVQIDDLRFIDGLNATFESWGSGYEEEARVAFLAMYRSTLGVLVEP
ncbi:hypothetical protein [Bradyrhizobium sp.]|uniref:hypothetical protein n=1 Tax=Bradyrhizobium sp. TaxID=376 RepID=UPI001D2F7ABA|nr:hypothetical protein [Bradyrhizobium sp.]MBI5321072.1 hypothetical protein [Bradyrhizobium sp.]